MFGFGDKLPEEVRKDLETFGAEFGALQMADAARLRRYTQYRAENSRSRKDNIVDRLGGEWTDYSRKQTRDDTTSRHSLSIPLGKATTVKHAYRISGMLPDAIVDRRSETPEERYRSNTMEKIVWAIHRASSGDAQVASGAWHGSELGATVFELEYRPGKIPTYRSIDPAGCLVVRGVSDPHDYQRVYRFWSAPVASLHAEYRDKTFRGIRIPIEDIRSETGEAVVVQMCNRERAFRFVAGCDVPLWELQHDYGFVPYQVIPNIGPFDDVWGWSDYEFIRDIVLYLENLHSREADVIRATAAGAYQSTGGMKQSPAVIARILREGGVLPGGKEGKVEPIQAAEMPAFEEAHAERMLRLFEMASFSPPAAWGSGNAGSGSDRGLQLQPQIEYTALKQINWAAGLSRLMEKAFRIIEMKQEGAVTYSGIARKPGTLRSNGFSVTLDSQKAPERGTVGDLLADGADAEGAEVTIPHSPRELFDGDYTVRFVWNNRVDPDDPAYVQSETNRFVTATQSLETTLERLGCQAPEDEIKRIADEAELYPWLRQGMIAMIQTQLDSMQQGQGGGGDQRSAGDVQGALVAGMSGAGTRATDADLLSGALGGRGTRYGSA